MAVNIITSGFLLLVLAAGVQSATVELNGDCTKASDQCVSPLALLVCDTPPGKPTGVCRVKSGQPCNAAGGLCVIGAKCVSNVCTCQAGYTTVTADGQCTPPNNRFYAACTAGSVSTDCPAGTSPDLTGLNNAACDAKGGCQCAASGTTVPDYSNGKCVALGNNQVEQTCDPNSTPTAVCGTGAGLTCVTNKCVCDPGYFPTKTPGGTCVDNTAVSSIGKLCPNGVSDCKAANNEVCGTAPVACKCGTGFTGQPGGACFPVKGSLKGGCSVDGDCTGGPTKCTSYNSAPMTCKTALAATTACTANPTTEACGNGLVCDTTCKTALAVGAACTANPTTEACGTGLVCDTTCKTVLPKDGDCSAANTKCGTGLTCVATKCIQSNANTVTITAFLVMAVAAVGKLMM